MHVNLTSAKFIRHQNTIEIKLNKEGMLYPTSFYVSKGSINSVLSCLYGKAEEYPYFSDADDLIRFFPVGCRYIKLNKYYGNRDEKNAGNFSDYQITFPGTDFGMILKMFLESNEEKYEIPASQLAEWKETYKPNIKIFFHDCKEKYYQDMKSELLSEDAPDFIQHFINIGENHSQFGEPIEIHIYSERNYDTSELNNYYFSIIDTTKSAEWKNDRPMNLIMNGGIIFHKDYKNEGKFTVSSHT